MARVVRDARLESREARKRLPAQKEPHWKAIAEGWHLGYYKGRREGTWIARYRPPGGKYKKRKLGTADDIEDANGSTILDFKQAQEIAREWFRDCEQTRIEDERLGPYTVKQALADYLEWFRGERKSVVETESSINSFILPELGDHEVAKLTTQEIRRWHRKLAETPPRARTAKGKKQRYREFDKDDPEAVRRRRSSANRILTVLKATLNHAFNDEKTPSDEAWRRVKPFKKVDAARPRYLSKAECKRLVNACEPDFRQLVQGGLYTGCRYGELTALRVEDFNADAGTLHVRASKSDEDRHVVLTDEAQRFFKSTIAGKVGSDLIFRRSDGEAWGKAHQARPIGQACRRAKISPPANFHSLRHTYASHLVMGRATLLAVARNLGHGDTRMVEKHYAHLAPDWAAKEIRAAAPSLGIAAESNVTSISDRREPQ